MWNCVLGQGLKGEERDIVWQPQEEAPFVERENKTLRMWKMSVTTLKVIYGLIIMLNVFTNKYNKDLFLLYV